MEQLAAGAWKEPEPLIHFHGHQFMQAFFQLGIISQGAFVFVFLFFLIRSRMGGLA